MYIPTGEQSYATFNGIQLPLINIKVWDVQVKWRDQSTDWITLNLIKESNPIVLSEHSMATGYSNKPAFRWWVRKVLKKRDRLVKKFKMSKNRFKFGVEVTLTVEYALRIYWENGNTLWHDSIGK